MEITEINARIWIKNNDKDSRYVLNTIYENTDFVMLKYYIDNKDISVELNNKNYKKELYKVLKLNPRSFKLQDIDSDDCHFTISTESNKKEDLLEFHLRTYDLKYSPKNILELIQKTSLLSIKEIKNGHVSISSYSAPSGLPSTYTDRFIDTLEMVTHAQGVYWNFPSVSWLTLLPSEASPERESDPFISDDVLLNAPVYKSKKLTSGTILIQLTQDYDVNKVDHKYIETEMNFYKYLFDFVKNKIGKDSIPTEVKTKIEVGDSGEFRKLIIRKNNKGKQDINYLIKAHQIKNYENIQSDDNNDDYESLDKSSIEKTQQQITHFYEDYDQYLQLIGVDENYRFNSEISIKSYENISEYELMYLKEKPIHEVLEFVEKIGLLDDPDIFNGYFYLENVYHKGSFFDVSVINPNKITYFKYGFYIYWWFIIPPKGHPERPIDPFENDDIFLKAPVYKAQRLKSGATLIQLTKEYNYLNSENKEYVDTLLKFNEYLKNNMKKSDPPTDC